MVIPSFVAEISKYFPGLRHTFKVLGDTM
jgi:hypothetical protein